MASALIQNQASAQGKVDVKSIPLAWFVTSSFPNSAPELLPDYNMPANEGNDFKRLSQDQAVQRLKNSKKDGQSLYDWYLSRPDTDETKQMLITRGKANSTKNFLVNGIFSDKQLAEKVSGMTTQQLIDMGKADQALQTNIQAEQAAQTASPIQQQAQQPIQQPGTTPSIPFKEGLTDAQKKNITNLISSGRTFNETDAKNYAFATGQTDYQQFINKSPSQFLSQTAPQAPKETVSTSLKPTEYSVGAKLDTLQKTILDTQADLAANEAFINGVFKAFHNRDVTKQELEAYKGKKVSDVRTEIIGGAQAAGLPTVAPGTVNIPTGMMTKEEAAKQGLQKVLRPDQLSALKEDQ